MPRAAITPDSLSREIERLLAKNPELDQALRLFAISAEEYSKAFSPPTLLVSGSTSPA